MRATGPARLFPATRILAGAALLVLAGCAGGPFGRDQDGPPPPPADQAGDGQQPAAEGAGTPQPSQQARRAARPDGSPEQIDPNAAPPPPEQPGFFSRLARSLGSESNTPNVGPCPPVRVLYDASRFVQVFGSERFENIGYTGEINGTQSSCRYIGNDPITVELAVDMAFGKGPRAAERTTTITYWVAVTQIVRSTDAATGQVLTADIGPLAKQRFTQTVTFPEGADRVVLTTDVTTVTIPRANERISGSNFEVLVGFELTPEQLQFNRDGKRFRIDAGAPR